MDPRGGGVRVGAGVARPVVDLHPKAIGLIGVDARSADLGVQELRDREGLVADRLGVEPQARRAREEPVLWVRRTEPVRARALLSVGRREHHALQHGLHIPAALDELQRQVVEQLRVAGACAACAKVLESLYEAAPEEALPVAVDRDARGQRVLG